MSEMVERVAKAIYEGRNGIGAKPWCRLTRSHQGEYIGDARAAIEAIREINLPMETAGLKVFNSYGWQLNDRVPLMPAQAVFTAMIDAALSEGPA